MRKLAVAEAALRPIIASPQASYGGDSCAIMADDGTLARPIAIVSVRGAEIDSTIGSQRSDAGKVCPAMETGDGTAIERGELFAPVDHRADDSQKVVVSGPVALGRQIGRTLGFPTANVAVPPDLIQLTGVYAVRSWLPDGRQFEGVASLGCNPTIPKDAPVLEVWLFDFEEDIYGQLLTTQLVTYLRDEEKFPSVDALKEQVFRDADHARRVLRQATLALA